MTMKAETGSGKSLLPEKNHGRIKNAAAELARRLKGFSINSLSLRARLILGGITVMIVPLFIVGSVILFYLSQSLENMARTQTAQIARDMANLMESILKEELKVISAFSVDPQIIEAASTDRFEKSILKLSRLVHRIGSDYESITIANRRGIISSDIHVDRIGINVADRDYFLRAMEGKASIGPPYCPGPPESPYASSALPCWTGTGCSWEPCAA